MVPLTIWFVVSEIEGLVKSGGLADVAKALPKALHNLSHDVSVIIPGYRSVPRLNEAKEVLTSKLDFWPHTSYKIKQVDLDGIPVYVVDCPQYFNRPELYAENNEGYTDNAERFAFFSLASLDCLSKLGIQPNIIHANDWHTGLVPFLLKTRYRDDLYFTHIRSVLTVHNAIFQGIFSYDELRIIPELKLNDMEHLRYSATHVGLLRAGLAFADKINAVSPNYAKELLTPLGAHGLVDDFTHRAADLTGILNGCDSRDWNPQKDKYIPVQYLSTAESMKKGKAASKALLQQENHLPYRDVPLFGMVCRLSHQKGFDYLLPILEQFLRNDVQIIIIGTGDPFIATQLQEISARNRDKFIFLQMYSNRIAHLIEAGADFFLMPSEFEACGLNQIYSMAYGTLPIVRNVGGLKDTVIDYDQNFDEATGFSFHQPEAKELLITMQRALLFYLQEPKKMEEIQLRTMSKNFNWDDAATAYLDMYRAALALS